MKVRRLTLKHFRNIKECTFEPDPGLNFLSGRNGQGKTSFLEALGFLATLRSFRGGRTPEVIQWGEQEAEIHCLLSPDAEGEQDWKTDLKTVFSLNSLDRSKASKVAFINGKSYKSSSSYLSQRFGNYELGFHTVVFNPSDHDLVRNEPAIRRAYLDRVIAAENVDYLRTLQKYQRTLEQRNALLKSSEKPRSDLLAGFTEPLAKQASALVRWRLEWIFRLQPGLDVTLRQIAPTQPFLRLLYASNWVPEITTLSYNIKPLNHLHFAGQPALPSLELLEQAFWKKQSAMEPAEWKTGHTLVGPHRDDWHFTLGEQVLKGHGSQGEVRSALLSLKLCEIELFRTATGHRPVFLLDDFSSELDRERRSFLLEFLSKQDLQVFVTTTDNSFQQGTNYRVTDGQLEVVPSGTQGSVANFKERTHGH